MSAKQREKDREREGERERSKAGGRERPKHSVERVRRGNESPVGARSSRRLKFGWLSRAASTVVEGGGIGVPRRDKSERAKERERRSCVSAKHLDEEEGRSSSER